jgi:tetratricopeptide (TPR) repeat protein
MNGGLYGESPMKTRREEWHEDLAGQGPQTPGQDQRDMAEELLLLIEEEPALPVHVEQLADLYAQRGRHDLAIVCAQQAVARDPEDPRLLRLLGRVLEAAGEPNLARTAYLAAVAVGANPRHPQPWLGLARLERAEGRLVTAEQHARRALDLAPHSADVYAELVRILLQGGRVDHALTMLAHGLRWAPGDLNLIELRDGTHAAAPPGDTARQDQVDAPSAQPP